MPSTDQDLSTRIERQMFAKQATKTSDRLLVGSLKLWVERVAEIDAELAAPRAKTHTPNGFNHGSVHNRFLPRVLVTSSTECAAQRAHQAFINRAPFRVACSRISSETTRAAIMIRWLAETMYASWRGLLIKAADLLPM